MNKMAMDAFSTFLLYLVENLLRIVRVRKQSRCHHGDGGGGGGVVVTALLWRNSN